MHGLAAAGGAAAQAGHRRLVRQAAPPDGRGAVRRIHPAHYSREEIEQAQNFLRPERDELFTYSGLDLLLKRYVIHDRAHAPLETPQEMFLGIALHLAMRGKAGPHGWVQNFTICSAGCM